MKKWTNTTLNNPSAPSTKDIMKHTSKLKTEEEKLDYLSKVATHDFKCPDACDKWALKWLEEHEG